jgi:hypothetical protein
MIVCQNKTPGMEIIRGSITAVDLYRIFYRHGVPLPRDLSVTSIGDDFIFPFSPAR